MTKYPSLNGLRALSIIFVVLSHLFLPLPVAIRNILANGQLGVNIFFVISGFLITNLLLREKFETGKISLKKFYIRRTLRIFPAYYFLLIFYFVLENLDIISITNISWVTAITYTKYFNWNLDWYTAHGWSLSIEEHFYLLWPFVFLFGRKLQHFFLFSIILVCPVFRLFEISNNLTIFHRLDAIAFGCLAALNIERVRNFVLRFNRWILFLSVCWIVLFPYLDYLNINNRMNINWFIIPFGGSIGTLTNISVSFIIVYSVYKNDTIWFKFLNLKIMEYIGLLSYSIYLWQQVFTSKLDFVSKIYPYNIFFIIGSSLISYYIIEKPFLRLKNKYSAGT